MDMLQEVKNLAEKLGVSDIGFCRVDDGIDGLNNVISVVIRLSDAIIDEIDKEPTHTYFHHYRTVNAFIDRTLLEIGLLLQKHGYRYIPVAASQSINKYGNNYQGRYSHKKAATSCGLGGIGKNSLFIHKDFGAAVRLGTIFTDCDFGREKQHPVDVCVGCDLCVKSCPAMAIKGVSWYEGIKREEMFDPKACSEYMKRNFQHIGRGAVCGICINRCMRKTRKQK